MLSKKLTVAMILAGGLGATGTTYATIIDFTGGTAHLYDGTNVVTNNTTSYTDLVDYYDEGGFRFDFIGSNGTVGNYYAIGARPDGSKLNNDVVHAHWGGALTSMTITALDGASFDLNYIDLTSNTVVGGGQSNGLERSYITTNTGYSMLLPSSDWGFDYDYFGAKGDGVARLYLDSNFDNVTSVTFTSLNAYCFGMDNFYINEAGPSVPEPATLALFGLGLVSLGFAHRRKS